METIICTSLYFLFSMIRKAAGTEQRPNKTKIPPIGLFINPAITLPKSTSGAIKFRIFKTEKARDGFKRIGIDSKNVNTKP